MELVDTSAWVALFRDAETAIDLDVAVTCPPVVQEVLQGFQNERAFRTARISMNALPIVEDPMPSAVFVEAADVCRAVRRTGLTVRPGMDCLIAVCALRHDLTVVHVDRDFETIARVTGLRTRSPLS